MTTYQITHEFAGYFVITTHGHTRRETITYARDARGQWFDLDGSSPTNVKFQEGPVPPEWSGVGDPRDGRDDLEAIAAIYPNELCFVLDPDAAAWLLKEYPGDIDAWPHDEAEAASQIRTLQRNDPVGWVLHMGGPTVDQALVAFLTTWHAWTSGEPDSADIEEQIIRTVKAMVTLAQCENAIGDAAISFNPATQRR